MRISRSLIALVSFVVLFASIATPAYIRGEFHASASITNSPPVAVDDGPYAVHRSAQLSPNVLANDSDPDGDPIFFDLIGQSPAHGFLSLGNGGAITYTVASNYVGPDSFTYRIGDNVGNKSNFATVRINVVNDPPVAANDSYTIHNSKQLNPNVMANDSDPNGDAIFFDVIVQSPSHGTLSFGQGDLIIYNAHNVYVGPDSFTYRIKDSLGLSAIGTVNIDIVNQAPVAVNDLYVIRGTQTQQLFPGVLANDFDPDNEDYILFDIVVQFPTHGNLSLGGNGTDIIHYTPQPGYAGSDTFTYKMTDNLAVRSNIATVTLLVLGDGENDGRNPCNSSVGGPVNVTNGNMYLQQNDHSLPSTGPAININRTYNSNSQRTALFGRGWSTTYDESIRMYDNNLVRLNQSDGRAIYLSRAVGSAGAFSPLEGDFHGQVIQNGGGFTLMLKDGSFHQFNGAGKLLSMADRNGNSSSLVYDGNGFLSSVTNPFGSALTFTTNANGQVLLLSDALGTIANYTYGAGNVLLSVSYADNSGFQFSYDGANRLTSVTDALGNVVESHTYDGQGRAVTSEKQGGVEHYTLSYVSANETDVTDALSHVTKYTFDTSKGRNVVTKVEGDCSCGSGGTQVRTWTYDNQLNVTSMTDALSHTTSYTYDGNGNRLSETDSLGTANYTYNQFGDVLTATDKLGNLTSNTYDANGNLLSTEDALHNTSTLTYNARGQLLTATDARGRTTTFTFSATTGNLTKTKDALTQITTYTYDVRNRVTRIQDPLGRSTYLAYDLAGRLNKITHADNTFVTFTYDLAGRRTRVTDELGNSTNYAFDAAYRSTGTTDAANQTTSYGYDAMSNLTSMTDSLARVTNYDYDDFNRLVKITYPPATSGATRLFETFLYDADGNVTQRTDTAGRVTSYAYDNVNRLASMTDANGKTTSVEYDAGSRVIALTDAINQRYQFFYDALGRQVQMTRGGVSMFYAYDEVGNRMQRTDYNGAVTTYGYDNINRVTTITYPTRAVSYSYNLANEITRATNENGSIYLGYDNRYRLNSVFDPFNYGITYNYDAVGNRTKLSLNYATYATYTYDATNRLTNLKDSANQSFTYNYDTVNRLTNRAAPNGVTTSYAYDGLDRLTGLTHASGATTLINNQYQYNAANNIASWVNASGNHAYGYDPLDRLTSAANSAQPNESYAYDSVGNRASSHLSVSYNYQPFNKLTSTATASYVYDNNGNLISRTDGSGTTTFTWNEENQLTQVTRPTGVSVNYKYDALGRRIQRTTSAGASERYVYDGQDVLLDLNADWSVATTYLNDLGIDNHLRQTSSATGVSYYLTDHLGSTAGLTDANGNLVEQLAYDSFGNSTGSTRTRYGYTGRERDPDTSLIYYRARSYDPQVGRFISEDPIGLDGGINSFAYVSNNPQNATDPSGLYEIDVHYYLTYYLAMKTGCFKDWEARKIAEGDQRSDEDNDKKPGWGYSFVPAGIGFTILPDEAQQQRNVRFHAFGTPDENAQRLLELQQAAMHGSGDLSAYGTYLHFLQDLHSHSPYAGNRAWGQASGGFSPDHTNTDVRKAMDMARATWDALNDLARNRKCGCQGNMTPSDWQTVNEFAKAPGGSHLRELSPDELEKRRLILGVRRR